MARNQWKLAHIWNAMSIRTFGFLFTNRPDYIVVTTGVDKSMQKNFSERVANVHRKNQTNATCVIIHLLMQAIWGHIWKCTVEKSQTNATCVIMHPLMQVLWRHIWKHTVVRSQTNATNVSMHHHMQAVLEGIWKRTLEKSPRGWSRWVRWQPTGRLTLRCPTRDDGGGVEVFIGGHSF